MQLAYKIWYISQNLKHGSYAKFDVVTDKLNVVDAECVRKLFTKINNTNRYSEAGMYAAVRFALS